MSSVTILLKPSIREAQGAFPQAPTTQTFTHENWALANTTATSLRATCIAATSYFKTETPETFLGITRILALSGIIYAVPNFCRKAYKVTLKGGWKRFDNIFRSVYFAAITTDCTSTALKGATTILGVFLISHTPAWVGAALKAIAATASPLFIVGTILYSSALIVHIRDLMKTRSFKKEFDSIHLEEDGLKKEEYQKFKDLIHRTSDTALKRHFQVDGKLLRARLNYLDAHSQDHFQVSELIRTLRGRIDSTIHNEIVQIVADTASLVASALIITSFGNPVGYAFLGVYCLALLVNFGYKKAAAYSFDHQVGMIIRKGTDPFSQERKEEKRTQPVKIFYKTVDFTKWFFGQHERFNLPRVELPKPSPCYYCKFPRRPQHAYRYFVPRHRH